MSTYWIFIAVCGIILSIAKKNQNKQRKRASIETPTPDAQSPQTELERQLRELFGERPSGQQTDGNTTTSRPTHQKVTSTATRPIPTKVPRMGATTKNKTIKAAQHKDITTNNNTTLNDSPKSTPNNGQIEEILEDFSMEKAVIYSEILKPKYDEY